MAALSELSGSRYVRQDHTATPILPQLQNARLQIRLLQITPSDADTELTCTVTVHELRNAPDFHAISYAWGDEQPQQRISVDHHRFSVRQNCYQALQQASRHSPGMFIWIDSICINQADPTEKSTQVEIMGDIYARATKVLACVGNSDESSDYLYRMVSYPEFWKRTGFFKDDANIGDFMRHWSIFGNRPYFFRLWVLQELKEGQGRIDFLFGTQCISWKDYFDLDHDFEEISQKSWIYCDIHCQLWNVSHRVGPRLNTLLDVLTSAHEAFCSDPRDRIYGTLRLVDWQFSGGARPIPDYTISRWDLAVKLLEDGHIPDIRSVHYLTSALRLSIHDVSIHHESAMLKAQTTQSWWMDFENACLIAVNAWGRLCADLITFDPDVYKDIDNEVERAFREFYGSDGLIEIVSGTQVAALASPHVLPGDIIVHTRFFTTVVRPHGDQKFLCISPAIMINGARIPRSSIVGCECSGPLELEQWLDGTVHAPASDVLASVILRIRIGLNYGGSSTWVANPEMETSHTAENRRDTMRKLVAVVIPPIGTLLNDLEWTNPVEDHDIPGFWEGCNEHGAVDVKLVRERSGLLGLVALTGCGNMVKCVSKWYLDNMLSS